MSNDEDEVRNENACWQDGSKNLRHTTIMPEQLYQIRARDIAIPVASFLERV